LHPTHKDVSIAGVNGPKLVVMSGRKAAITKVCKALTSQGVKHKELNVSNPFHSPLMEPILKEFKAVADTVTFNSPRAKFVSAVTGKIEKELVQTAEYWVKHIRSPVLFSHALTSVSKLDQARVFLEIGLNPVNISMGKRVLTGTEVTWLPSMRQSASSQSVLRTCFKDWKKRALLRSRHFFSVSLFCILRRKTLLLPPIAKPNNLSEPFRCPLSACP
jgi:acyl transferase domain-containing protein